MARTYSVAALVATAALCMAALVGVAQAKKDDTLYVEGKVYCDTCRVQFETPLSHRVEGATVTLLCRDRTTENVTVEIDALTDKAGEYSIKVNGNHENEICEVHLTKPGSGECDEVVAELNAARILLTKDVGLVEPVRRANALGFMKKVALENCGETLQAMGFLPIS